MEKSIFFITGATGFIGSSLCAQLVKRGYYVRALVRQKSVPYLENLGIELIVGDLNNSDTYIHALTEIDYVIHLGGDPTFGNGQHYYRANFETTCQLLKEVKKTSFKLKRFVYISSFGAVDRKPKDPCIKDVDESFPANPTTDYGRSKLMAESSVKESGLPWSIIRPTLVVGETMRVNSHVAVFIRKVLYRSLLSWFDLPGRFSIIHVDDLAKAIITVAFDPKASDKIYFSAGEKVSLGQIFRWVDQKQRRFKVSLLLPVFKLFNTILPFQIKSILFDGLTANDSSLRQLGWEPKMTAKECITQVIEVEKRRKYFKNEIKGYTIVTGAASGLGATLAKMLFSMGRRLILVDKDAEGLTRILPDNKAVQRLNLDLSVHEDVKTLLSISEWDSDGVDEVFSCAGFGARGLVSKLGNQLQVNIFNVNVNSRISLVQHALTYMIQKNFGRIVMISSSSAFQALPFMAAYAASNSALLSFGEALWGETKGSGVEILTVCPGGMQTNFQKNAGVKELPNERLDSPEYVAIKILKALGKDKGVLLVGTRALSMDLLSRLLPRYIQIRLWKRLMNVLR